MTRYKMVRHQWELTSDEQEQALALFALRLPFGNQEYITTQTNADAVAQQAAWNHFRRRLYNRIGNRLLLSDADYSGDCLYLSGDGKYLIGWRAEVGEAVREGAGEN